MDRSVDSIRSVTIALLATALFVGCDASETEMVATPSAPVTLIRDGDSEGFFRPYAEDRGGVAVEPWHLSHRPSATLFASRVPVQRLLQLWSGAGHAPGEIASLEALELDTLVAAEAEALLQRYVRLDSGQ